MPRTFPPGFRWGVATSGHQTEGGNTGSDTWFLEHVRPTVFREPSGLACNGYQLWREDVDLAAGLGLDAYRFSVEWARVEPAEGEFSAEALAHYRAIADRCVEAGIAPVVTYNHFTAPHWFARRGGWLDPEAPALFRDRKRAEVYGMWLDLARDDDFVGVQNYERAVYDARGPVPPPPGAALNQLGSSDIYPLSLAGAVRYAHEAAGVPVFVTEHGLGHQDDSLRAALLEPALAGLLDVIEDGVPVLGYLHWSLLDNFEWVFGFDVRFGLHEVDRATFARTPKPSAAVYAAIARANAGAL